MSDKNFDVDDILNEDRNNRPKVTDEEVDDILASINNKKSNADNVDTAEIETNDNISDDTTEASENIKAKNFELNINYEDDYEETSEDETDDIAEFDEPEPKPRKKKRKTIQGANNSIFGGLLIVIIILSLSCLIALTGITVGRDMLGFGDSSNTFTINIPEGSTTSDIAQILTDEGIIQYPEVFMFIVKLSEADGKMYPGDIELSANMSYEAIVNRLCTVREEKPVVSITFKEGITLYEAAQLLELNGVCDSDDFIYTFNNVVYGYDFEDLVTDDKLEFYKMEGYVFPDTYEFYLDDNAYNVAKKFKANFASKVNYNMLDRAQQLGYTLDEVITLASIVQMEAGDKYEMEKVASVFINRLNNPIEFPRLQSDTTDNYVENVIKPLSSIDYQEMYDAYDTYVGNGLPPGAICNPGLDAINAVLYPEQTDYYYFCSNIDTREFFYAKTLAEHNENLVLAGLA